MMENAKSKPNIWFWVIGVVGLIWNGLGSMNYIMHTTGSEALKESYTPEQLAFVEASPAWVTGAFALAVWGGLLGCLLLLLRKKWAVPVLLVSLIGIVGQAVYNFFLSNASEVFGSDMFVMPVLVILIGLGLYLYSRSTVRKGWIN